MMVPGNVCGNEVGMGNENTRYCRDKVGTWDGENWERIGWRWRKVKCYHTGFKLTLNLKTQNVTAH